VVAYTYSRVAALNFNTTPPAVAKSATGSVYAIADTTFTTPLTITMVVGGSTATTISSDAQGFFPDFTVADRTSVVWKQASSSFTTVLTTSDPVPGATGATGSAGATGAQGPRGDLATWLTATFYPLNQVIANPSGDLVKVTTAHTSGATYDATKFGWVNNNAANLTGILPAASLPSIPEANLPANLAAAQLNATYAPVTGSAVYGAAAVPMLAAFAKPLANTFVVAGDSITESAGANGGRTFWAHAVGFSNRKIKVLYNAGVGGNTTAQLVARFTADVLSKGSDWVHILIGRNDLADTADGGYTPVTDGITTLLNACRDAGKKVVVGTLIPSTGLTANQASGLQRINQWIRDLPFTRPVIVADYNAALANPADGAPITGLLYDGTHPGYGGAARMGRVLADTVDPFLSPTSVLLNSETDVKQLLSKGRFSGAGVGAAPTSWFETGGTGGGTRTYSKVARTDGVNGSWQRIVNSVGTTIMLASNVNIGATLAIGDTVNFRVEYKASAAEVLTSAQYLFISLACYNGAGFTTEVFDMSSGAGAENVLGFDRSGVFLTSNLLIPSGTTLIQARIQIGGGLTLDVDRASVQKV
jgi:lysophospholipase L1-like esterase